MALLKKLLNNLAFHLPAILTEEEGNKHPKELEALISLGVLKQDTFPQERWCPSCESESVSIQVSEKRTYTLCTRDEEAARDYFDPQTLKQWRFDTLPFISLFLKTLDINQPSFTENISGLLWDLGTQKVNGASYHLFFCRNIDEIEKSKLSILTALPHSVVFYAGTPHTALPDRVLLVPITDLIQQVTNKRFSIEKELLEQFFPVGVYATKEGTIELDDNFVLQNNHLLFEPLRGGVFRKQSSRLRPLASRIINHLYGIRNYQKNAKSLDELAEALSSTKVSISNEIGRIEKVSADKNLQPILHKYASDEWGINPQLKCCK